LLEHGITLLLLRYDGSTRFRDKRAFFRERKGEIIHRGVFAHPDVFKHWFLSTAHTRQDVATILEAAEDALQAIAGSQVPAR
jgi:glutamate-1-semialdehyde aminotransferase